jgi:transcriptional regulator with XRE-family HTH domain
MSANDTITTVVNRERMRRGLNQAQLAEMLGRGDMWVSHKLNGRRRWQVDDLDLLAERLEIPLPMLLVATLQYLRSLVVTLKYHPRTWRVSGGTVGVRMAA